MYVFKTSGRTLGSVIANLRHAFVGQPKDWRKGELILVSKNRTDVAPGERQIRFTMRFSDVRPLRAGEAEKYWPGTEGRWRYIVECTDKHELQRPFDLAEALGADALPYGPVITFRKCPPADERRIVEFLKRRDADVL